MRTLPWYRTYVGTYGTVGTPFNSLSLARQRAMIRQEVYLHRLQNKVYSHYDRGLYGEALHVAEEIYHIDAVHYKFIHSFFCETNLRQARTDNLLALGAISFQLRNFSEAVFYNQQVPTSFHLLVCSLV
jgi:hypothetical protein